MSSGGQKPAEGKEEVRATEEGDGKRGGGCLDLRPDILGGGPVSDAVRVGDVGYDPMHREGFGQIPPQGGL